MTSSTTFTLLRIRRIGFHQDPSDILHFPPPYTAGTASPGHRRPLLRSHITQRGSLSPNTMHPSNLYSYIAFYHGHLSDESMAYPPIFHLFAIHFPFPHLRSIFPKITPVAILSYIVSQKARKFFRKMTTFILLFSSLYYTHGTSFACPYFRKYAL